MIGFVFFSSLVEILLRLFVLFSGNDWINFSMILLDVLVREKICGRGRI